MSIFTTSGRTFGGGGLPVGMLRLTECSWIGSVMISMTKHQHHIDQRRCVDVDHDVRIARADARARTHVHCHDALLSKRTMKCISASAKRWLGNEADLRNARPLA